MSAQALDTQVAESGSVAEPPHPLRELYADFARNRGAVAGLLVIGALVLIAATANVIAPYSPVLTNDSGFLRPPARTAA